MGKKGFLAALGASGALAVAAALGLIVASLHVSLEGWPGMRASSPAEQSVELGATPAPGAPERSVTLVGSRPKPSSARRARVASRRTKARGRSRQRVMSERAKGRDFNAASPVHAVPADQAAPPAEAAPSAPERPVGQTVDDVQGVVRDATEPVAPVVGPVLDQVDRATDRVAGTLDDILP